VSDVFISYAREDRALAGKLAAWVQERGCSVWWDRNLLSGSNYESEIRSQIGKAVVAFIIWSRSSIQSDWVRAEAKMARAAKKFMPFKTGSLSDEEIPLPFGTYNTPWIEDLEAVANALASRGLAVSEVTHGQRKRRLIERLIRSLFKSPCGGCSPMHRSGGRIPCIRGRSGVHDYSLGTGSRARTCIWLIVARPSYYVLGGFRG
jgi:hypothetical protein